MILWFTGMSGAGKSTLANKLSPVLKEQGYSVHMLDGDAVRKIQKTETYFSRSGILENNYTIINSCTQLLNKYDFILVSVISPFTETREYARHVLKENYFEIYIKCSRKELVRRDTKGLYKKAINKEINNLIGISESSPYQEPINAHLTLQTDTTALDVSINRIIKKLKDSGHL